MIPLCELKPVGAGVRKDGSRFFVGCVCHIVRLLITTNNVVLVDSICIPIKIVSDLDNITVYIYFIEHSIFFYNSCFSTKKRVCIIIFEGYYYFTIFVYIAPKFTLSNGSKTMSKKPASSYWAFITILPWLSMKPYFPFSSKYASSSKK